MTDPTQLVRVLVVDDAPTTRRDLVAALAAIPTASGRFEAHECNDLHGALRALGDDGPFECILADLGLPGVSGTTIVDRLQMSYPEVPVIALGDADDDAIGEQALRRGAQDYLSHTDACDPETLARSINHAVARGVAAAALVEGNRQLAAFAGRVAHDLRSPLAVTTGMLQLIERKAQDVLDEELAFLFSRAVSSAQRAGDMVSSLLMYAQAIYPDAASENVELSSVLGWARDTVELSTADVTFDFAPDLPVVFGNSGALQQVFVNLFGNALKYADPERAPVIIVRSRPDENLCHIEVVDNGIGIPEDLRRTVFDEGTQVDSTNEGFGLGLPAVRAIVERFGGETWVDAGDDGTGTTVHLRLPPGVATGP